MKQFLNRLISNAQTAIITNSIYEKNIGEFFYLHKCYRRVVQQCEQEEIDIIEEECETETKIIRHTCYCIDLNIQSPEYYSNVRKEACRVAMLNANNIATMVMISPPGISSDSTSLKTHSYLLIYNFQLEQIELFDSCNQVSYYIYQLVRKIFNTQIILSSFSSSIEQGLQLKEETMNKGTYNNGTCGIWVLLVMFCIHSFKMTSREVVNKIQLYDPQSTHLIIRGFIQYL
jgi:hypothetical protein